MLERVMMAVTAVLMLALFGSIFAGGLDAVAAIFGQATTNHYAYVVLALAGFLAGGLAFNDEQEKPRPRFVQRDLTKMTRVQWAVTIGFIVVFVAMNQDMFDSRSQFVDGVLRCVASLLVWVVVVLFPWTVIYQKER